MWHILTADDLLSRLSQPEHAALDRAAVDWGQDSPIESIISEVAAEWRSALKRVCPVDTRAGATPSELDIHILADIRYRCFTRLPGMRNLMDELRMEEWRRANHIRDNLAKASYDLPDPQFLPDAEQATSGIPLPAFNTPRNFLD